MHFLNIFIIAVTVGLASCDIECFKKESRVCSNGKVQPASLLLNYCSVFTPYVSCLKTVADKCEFYQKGMENWLDVITDACTKGTKLNKDLKATMECIKKATTETECSRFPEEDLKDFKDTPEDKLFCREFGEMRHCLYREVKNKCGRIAEESFHTIYEPFNGFQLTMC